MNSRTLKIALAVSVALNLFAAAAAVTTWVGRSKVEARVEAQAQAPRSATFRQVLEQMHPEVRDRVRATLHASALSAKPDFEEARDARRRAIALSGEPAFDAAQVKALLDQSRDAEMRGRAKLEADAVRLLSTLDAGDRKALSQLLSRRGGRGGRGSTTPAAAQAPAKAPAQ